MLQIAYLFEPADAFSLGSYGAKHVLERDTRYPGTGSGNKYIGNGEFIVAMMLSGYDARFNRTPNAVFNASMKK